MVPSGITSSCESARAAGRAIGRFRVFGEFDVGLVGSSPALYIGEIEDILNAIVDLKDFSLTVHCLGWKYTNCWRMGFFRALSTKQQGSFVYNGSDLSIFESLEV